MNAVKVPAESIPISQAAQKPSGNQGKGFPDEPERAGVEPGWMVVHDENTPSQTFSLKPGKNVIGRYSPDKPCEIMIKTNDAFMSRNHSLIDITKQPDGSLVFVISDVGSTNGTFINAVRKLSRYDKLILKDGDTIQMGKTKIVLKTRQSTQDAQEAESKVKRGAYLKTVIMSK
ncbi:hypothetical protein ASG33_07175 [Dyadobacter sp. Leaf189]|nr:hypothetical protein ASG33_07175 [Dyadobacter sp. Leaf189]